MIPPFDPERVLEDEWFLKYEPIDITAFLQKIGAAIEKEQHIFQGHIYFTGEAIKFALTTPMKPSDTVPYCSIQFILAMLQKEQGLLSIGNIKKMLLKATPATMKILLSGKEQPPIHTSAWQKKLDYALSYGCRDKKNIADPVYPAWIGEYRGFIPQIWNCARRSRKLFDSWYPGKPLSEQPLDKVREGYPSKIIVPKNAVSYMIYEYNPRIEGARNLQTIFCKYFGGK